MNLFNKILKIFSIAIISLSFNINAATDTENYKIGFDAMKNFLVGYELQDDAYSAYVSKIVPCSKISGSVYHAGDSRFPREVCLKMLGAYDAFHKTTSSFSKCNKPTLPSDIVKPTDLIPSESCMSFVELPSNPSYCPAKTLVYTVGVVENVNINLPKTDNGATIVVASNKENTTCSSGSVVRCSVEASCANDTWLVKTEACNCEKTSTGSTPNYSDCQGTPPPNRNHCRCGKWVTWEVYKRTYEC